jgi:AraC family transcriptional regulator
LGVRFLAKIAVELNEALARRAHTGVPGGIDSRILAHGNGWTAGDLICTSGPRDRSFEEQHSDVSVAIVAAGSFQYRSRAGREFMTPGSILLGNAGQPFECTHQHTHGDRCIAFWFSPEYFESIAPGANDAFRGSRLPPLPVSSDLVAQACAGLTGSMDVAWEELAIQLAARPIGLMSDAPTPRGMPVNAEKHVSEIVRAIDDDPSADHSLETLADRARLSRYHFLRVFQQLTGVTPHQFILRTRLREAALRLASSGESVLHIALDCGFGDISNFNRTFRAEFGITPRAWRGKLL